MAEPCVSIILPVHNRAVLLARSVGSVLAQDFQDFELIVVDDASVEDLQGVLATFDDSRIRYLRRDENGGPAAARNTGLAAARGRYVAFQDSDDEWLQDKLSSQVAALDAAPAVCTGTVCGVLRLDNARLSPHPADIGHWPAQLDFASVAAYPFAYTQSWLVRREALLAAGRFDERLRVWEDWDLMLRLSQLGPLHCLPRYLLISDKLSDSLTMNSPRWTDAVGVILSKQETLLDRHSREMAFLRYLHARCFCQQGMFGAGRLRLLGVLRDRPTYLRAWLLLVASFGPRSWLQRRLS